MKNLIETAKLFENSVQPKKIMVNALGTEGQKNNFNKYNKFTGKTGESFIKTLNQYFQAVEEVKVGRSNQYKLGSVREEIAERERNIGKNATNGNWDKSTKHLDALILAHLEYQLENDIEIEKSYTNWLFEFNMINHHQKELYTSKFNPKLKEDAVDLMKQYVPECSNSVIKASYKFFQNDVLTQRGKLEDALKRMEKNNIVETFERPKAYLETAVKSNEGIEKHVVDVDMATYNGYIQKLAQLREKYKVSQRQIDNFDYEDKDTKKNVRAYKKELLEYKNSMRLKDTYGNIIESKVRNIWKELAIVVKATRKKKMDYLTKFHAEILKEYLEYKEEKYLTSQAKSYKSERTNERLETAERKNENHIKFQIERDKKENENVGFNRDLNIHESRARNSKLEFMKAIEILDKIYADKFIIDEEKLKQSLMKSNR